LYVSGVQEHNAPQQHPVHPQSPPPRAYGAVPTYEPVNDWSGVYTVPAEYIAPAPAEANGYFDYETPQQTSQQHDQSYYESVYAAYSQPGPAPEPQHPAPATPTWDGPAWQDPYAPAAFYGEPYAEQQTYPEQQAYADYPLEQQAYQLDEQYNPQAYGRQAYEHPGYEQNFKQDYEQPQAYAEPVSFHHPEFDTGQFEAVYAAPGSTDAAYDLLP